LRAALSDQGSARAARAVFCAVAEHRGRSRWPEHLVSRKMVSQRAEAPIEHAKARVLLKTNFIVRLSSFCWFHARQGGNPHLAAADLTT